MGHGQFARFPEALENDGRIQEEHYDSLRFEVESSLEWTSLNKFATARALRSTVSALVEDASHW
jgi:hypothetical protein